MTQQGALLAKRWRRVVGRLIDLIMWSPVIIGFGWVAVGSPTAQDGSDTTKILLALTATFATTVLIVIYEVASTHVVGATLGKKIVGTRIVDEGGADPEVRQLVLRMAPLIASSLLSAVPVIGFLTGPAAFVVTVTSFIFLSTDARRQTVWDKTGRTLVVRA